MNLLNTNGCEREKLANLPLEILREVSGNYTEELQKAMKTHGLTIAEFRLVSLIEDGVDTQAKLSEVTQIDTSTLSRQLKNAYKKEMITTTATGRDKRQLIYSVSENGKESVDAIKKVLDEINSSIFEQWNELDQTKFINFLNQINSQIKELSN